MGWMIFVIDTAFTSVPLNVRYFVDCESVLFIERSPMQGFCCSDCLFRRFVFYESEPLIVSRILVLVIDLKIPFCHFFLVERHVDRIFFRFAHRIQPLQQNFYQLLPPIFFDDWQAIYYNKCIQALFESNFILSLKICAIESVKISAS